jgi:hypothetical protein
MQMQRWADAMTHHKPNAIEQIKFGMVSISLIRKHVLRMVAEKHSRTAKNTKESKAQTND